MNYEIYKRYKDLPIPKLKYSFETSEVCDSARFWFEHYEKMIDSSDPVVLKNCLFYYLDESTSDNLSLQILALDYPTIKSNYINCGRIF